MSVTTGTISATEVSNLRRRGALIFSTDNEIMTVGVTSGQTLVPGDPIMIIGTTGFASKATAAGLNIQEGYGVVIHEGIASPGTDTNGDKIVQIATGNSYVAMEAAGEIYPFRTVTVSGTSGDIVKTDDLSAPASIAVNAVATYIGTTIGRYYGKPGEMVKPTKCADNDIIVVRLGSD